MKTGLAAILLQFACVVSACAAPGHFYLVQGPQSGDAPIAFSADIKGYPYPRHLSAVLINGEGFQGKWISASTGKIRIQDVPIPPQAELAKAWDTVYGQGFFLAHVLG